MNNIQEELDIVSNYRRNLVIIGMMQRQSTFQELLELNREQGAHSIIQGKGIYRGSALTTADTSSNAEESEEVFTEEVEVDRDYPDLIAGAPPKPTLTRRGPDLILNFQDPSDDGGTHLVRFAMEVYRDGTEIPNRIGRAQQGVRLGREKTWYNFGATFKGELKARVAAVNANSQDGGPLNWSSMSDPFDNTQNIRPYHQNFHMVTLNYA